VAVSLPSDSQLQLFDKLGLCERGESATQRQIRQALQMPDSTVWNSLAELVRLEYLEAEGGGAGRTTQLPAGGPRARSRSGKEPLVIDARVGSPVVLDAEGTADADGDGLSFTWFSRRPGAASRSSRASRPQAHRQPLPHRALAPRRRARS
jgi:hypothetical protein